MKRIPKSTVLSVWSAVLLMPAAAMGDVVILKDGKVIDGDVLQESANGVLVKLDYGTFTFPRSNIKEIKKASTSEPYDGTKESNRIYNWGRIVGTLAGEKWASDLKQIPATVIDIGMLRNIPYISFQCGSGGYELNIYGDLDHPAGVEIGVRKHYLENPTAWANCMHFAETFVADAEDKKVLKGLSWQKGIAKRDELTFEVTPPTDPDAYGGRWASIYSEGELDKARASSAELTMISQPMVPQGSPVAVAAVRPTYAPRIESPPQITSWSQSDLGYARTPAKNSSTGGAVGRVYARGYTRKDGTYVAPHTRSRLRK